jgi:Cu/Ag efflux protein CusF
VECAAAGDGGKRRTEGRAIDYTIPGGIMKVLVTSIIGFGLLAGGVGYAQPTKTLTGETQTVHATVEAIDQSSRQLTLKKDDGTYEILSVPASVKRFDSVKVGDSLTVRYYENVIVRLKPEGEADVDSASGGVVPAAGGKPSGTMSGQRTITAKITAIDPKVPSISFTGPNGWAYSTRVEDKAALAKVKVGDRVDITWTAAALMSFTSDTKSK